MMTKNRSIIFVIILLLFVFAVSVDSKKEKDHNTFPDLNGPYLGQKPPGLTPELFAPGIVSTNHNDFTPTFPRDGNEVCFTTCSPKCTLMFLTRENNRWTRPYIAHFSGKYVDADPFFSPDGKTLIFGSNRPLNGKEATKKDFDLWVVKRTKNGWSKPGNLGLPINSDKLNWPGTKN
jgi:hypothetical protein